MKIVFSRIISFQCFLERLNTIFIRSDRQTDTQTDRQTDTQTDTQTDAQTDTQTDTQTDRQTDIQTDRKNQIGFLYNIPGSFERIVLNVYNIQALHSFVKVKQYDGHNNEHGGKLLWAEICGTFVGYKYLLHKRVRNPLKFRRTMYGV